MIVDNHREYNKYFHRNIEEIRGVSKGLQCVFQKKVALLLVSSQMLIGSP